MSTALPEPASGLATAAAHPFGAADDTALRARLAAQDGVISAADLRSIGLGPNEVRRLLNSGVVRRVRPGCFVDMQRWSAEPAAGRHLLEARAALCPSAPHAARTRYAASHLTALVAWGLPVLVEDLGPIHVCRLDSGRIRRLPPLLVHGAVDAASVRTRHGLRVVAPALAIVQATRTTGARAGLMAADAALRAGLATGADLSEAVVASRKGAERRMPAACRQVLDLASAASESPGESWTRLVFHGLGLAQPQQQAMILDEHGAFVARVDFLFHKARLIVEFDGAIKYAGADGPAALIAEKRREDRLRQLGFRVVRLTWADLARPAQVAQLLGLGAGR